MREHDILFIIILGALVLSRTVLVATAGIRKFGLAGIRESRLLLTHLLLYAAAGLTGVIGGVEGSRLALGAFGGILVADGVMTWVGPKMTATPGQPR